MELLTQENLLYILIGIGYYFLFSNIFYIILNIFSFRGIFYRNKRYPFEELSTRDGFDLAPALSVIVPAYNEEKSIVASVNASLHLEYPDHEVIVSVDGATDNTLELLIENFNLVESSQFQDNINEYEKLEKVYTSVNYPNLIVAQSLNGGKSSALNIGVSLAKYEFVCCLDADSILDPKALVKITLPIIESPDVVAIGGTIRVVNSSLIKDGRVKQWVFPRNMLAGIQVPEFIRSFICNRVAWGWMNSNLIISGAFGVFKKDVLLAIGGYNEKSITEDMDIIFRIHKHMKNERRKYQIKFVPDPVCWTEVPTGFRHLVSQRKRWFSGMIDVFWSNKDMFMSPRYGIVGIFGIPLFFFTEVISPILEVISYILFGMGWYLGIVTPELLVIFFIISVLVHIINSVLAILLEESYYSRSGKVSDLFRITLYSFVENLGYRQVLNFVKFITFVTFPLSKNKWGYKERVGFE